MSLYARIADGVIAELFSPPDGVEIADCFAASVASQFVDVSKISPPPIAGHTATKGQAGWSFDAPAVPEPSVAHHASALMASGLAVAFTNDPTANGTYICDLHAQQMIVAELSSLMLNHTFTDGKTTIEWIGKAGASHELSVEQFKALAIQIGKFASACLRCIAGQSQVLPSAKVTIP